MRVISLGWGCQSFELAVMSGLGILPKVDAVIHADTTYERTPIYEFAKRWTPWLEDHGIPVVTVRDEKATQSIFTTNQTHVPAFTVREAHEEVGYYDDTNDESVWIPYKSPRLILGQAGGMLNRSCTQRWKIAPIHRWLQANRNGEQVEQWLGITLDEVGRMTASDVGYVDLKYPFIEMLDRPWTRGMVVQWLKDNGLEVPVKSACVMCPYHDRKTWREIKLSGANGDWKRAVEVDEAIRHKRPGYTCYLVPERKPLVDCDFSSQEDNGQLSLWGEECSGMCFL